MSVSKYRKMGYKIRVSHFRPRTEDGKLIPYSRKTKNKTVLQTGGLTQVDVTTPNGVTETAYAACSEADPFSYSVGTTIALGRALKDLNQQIEI